MKILFSSGNPSEMITNFGWIINTPLLISLLPKHCNIQHFFANIIPKKHLATLHFIVIYLNMNKCQLNCLFCDIFDMKIRIYMKKHKIRSKIKTLKCGNSVFCHFCWHHFIFKEFLEKIFLYFSCLNLNYTPFFGVYW